MPTAANAPTAAHSVKPYPVRCSGDSAAQIVLPGVPLGSFAGSTYDEASFDLVVGDVYVFCADGVSEARDGMGREFGVKGLLQVIGEHRHQSMRDLVDAIFAAVQDFRGETVANDDMTAVALKITL